MDGFQILILVPLDKYRTDYGCNKYKLHDVICANDYERNTDISNGISGYLWGVPPSVRYRGLEGNWAVVLATHDGYLMAVDKFYNIVKTRIGVVLHLQRRIIIHIYQQIHSLLTSQEQKLIYKWVGLQLTM